MVLGRPVELAAVTGQVIEEDSFQRESSLITPLSFSGNYQSPSESAQILEHPSFAIAPGALLAVYPQARSLSASFIPLVSVPALFHAAISSALFRRAFRTAYGFSPYSMGLGTGGYFVCLWVYVCQSGRRAIKLGQVLVNVVSGQVESRPTALRRW
jgi:hypothetical protein